MRRSGVRSSSSPPLHTQPRKANKINELAIRSRSHFTHVFHTQQGCSPLGNSRHRGLYPSGNVVQSLGLHYPELTMIARFAESILNAAAHALGYDCHVMFGADAASHLDTPKGALLGFSFTDHGKGDREYRGFGVTVIVSRLRVRPQVI